MFDNKKSLEAEELENRVAPILVYAPIPEPTQEPGGGGVVSTPDPGQELPKHDNPGQIRKVVVPL